VALVPEPPIFVTDCDHDGLARGGGPATLTARAPVRGAECLRWRLLLREAPGGSGSVQQPFRPGALMPFYPVVPPDVISSAAEDAALSLLGQAGMVAVRAADLASPGRRGLGRDGRTALMAGRAGSGPGTWWCG